MGIRMMATTEVILKDVRVPLTNLIGKENKGFYHVLQLFRREPHPGGRPGAGNGPGAYDRALAYVKQREQFGKKIAQFQVTSTSWPTWPPKSSGPADDLQGCLELRPGPHRSQADIHGQDVCGPHRRGSGRRSHSAAWAATAT
jgi:hypothetical protein